MRIILLVLLFLIWESWLPAADSWRIVAPDIGIPLFFSGYCLLILFTRAWGRRIATGMIKGDAGRAVDRFNIGIAIARIAIPTWFAVGVFALGWRFTVDRVLDPIAAAHLVLPGTIIGLIPGFMAWMGLWWSQFPVDRALREHNLLSQLEADLPVFAPPTFAQYFSNKLRMQLLFSVVPLMLILLLRDLASLGILAAAISSIGHRFNIRYPISDSDDGMLSFVSALVVLLFSPELLRRVLHTRRLPESPLRNSLLDTSRRAGLRCREILMWNTHHKTGNAAVMGLVPMVRYVMLSDLLLESMTELQIQAVFAHELGHVKHRHLAWFVTCFVTVGSCLTSLMEMLEHHLRLSETAQQVFDVSSAAVVCMIILIGYGFLSRWFERQADVFAARTLERSTEPLPADTTGASIFASALHRVAVVNNIPINARNWTHGSIQSRMRYIKRLGRDPKVAEKFDRTGRIVFAMLVCVTVICAAVAIHNQLRG